MSVPKDKLKKWLFWNGPFALLHSQAPPIMIASLINISELNFDTPFKYASSVLSIVVLVVLGIAVSFEIYLIRAHNGRYQLLEFAQRFGATVEGLNSVSIIGRYWNSLTIVRWALTVVVLVFVNQHGPAQIFLLLLISFIVQIVMIISPPMTDKGDQRMTWMIEFSVSLYLYVLLALTDFMG